MLVSTRIDRILNDLSHILNKLLLLSHILNLKKLLLMSHILNKLLLLMSHPNAQSSVLLLHENRQENQAQEVPN